MENEKKAKQPGQQPWSAEKQKAFKKMAMLKQSLEGMVSCTFSYDIPKIYGRSSKTDVLNMTVVAFVTKGEKGEVMQAEEARIVATTETEE